MLSRLQTVCQRLMLVIFSNRLTYCRTQAENIPMDQRSLYDCEFKELTTGIDFPSLNFSSGILLPRFAIIESLSDGYLLKML